VVDRFEFYAHDYGEYGSHIDTEKEDDGGWVEYEDYAALEARIAELEGESLYHSKNVGKMRDRAEQAEARVTELEDAYQSLRTRVQDHPAFGGKKPASLAAAAILGALEEEVKRG